VVHPNGRLYRLLPLPLPLPVPPVFGGVVLLFVFVLVPVFVFGAVDVFGVVVVGVVLLLFIVPLGCVPVAGTELFVFEFVFERWPQVPPPISAGKTRFGGATFCAACPAACAA